MPGLLIIALLDGAGIPLPTGVDALLVAISAMRPDLAPWAALLAIAGSAAGCLFLFTLARQGGRLYLERHTATGRGRKLKEWFERYGLVTVFVTLLSPVPLPTKIFVISAGALGVRTTPFLIAVLAGRSPRSIGLAYLGTRLGTHSLAWIKAHAWPIGLGTAVLLALLFLLIRSAGGRSIENHIVRRK